MPQALRPFASREAMIERFPWRGDGGERKRPQLALHPRPSRPRHPGEADRGFDARAGGGGLGRLAPEEFARFTDLNKLYKAKFDFPFIFAVKGATKAQILASFAERIEQRAGMTSSPWRWTRSAASSASASKSG